MLTRPWPIKILFICHILAPLMNTFFSAWVSSVPVRDFLHQQMALSSKYELISMYALLPLGGLVIYACKRWSYYLYLIIMAILFAVNFIKFREQPHVFDIGFVIGFFMINFLIVGYFLTPAVRKLYFDERLRWWESEPRYLIGLSGNFRQSDGPEVECKVKNISVGGARIHSEERIVADKPVLLGFIYGDEYLHVKGRVKHYQDNDYGIEFIHDDHSKQKIRGMVRAEFRHKFSSRDETFNWFDSFFIWLAKLLKTGKGLLPEPERDPENSLRMRRKKLKKSTVRTQTKSKKKVSKRAK